MTQPRIFHEALSQEALRTAVMQLREGIKAGFNEMSRLRHDTAVAKLPQVISFLQDLIDQGEKIVIFGHHHDVINAVKAAFSQVCVVIDGTVSVNKRQGIVDRFQNDPSVLMFIGEFVAAGVGITLTASSHVIFIEEDWTPGNISQAEDRCHRIGQLDSVLVQHLVLEGSFDAHMIQTWVGKQDVITDALDREYTTVDWNSLIDQKALARERKQATTPRFTLNREQVDQVHAGLRRIASMCDGARAEDGVGFNGLDTCFGRALAWTPELKTDKQAVAAAKLVIKYHGQIGKEYYGVAKAMLATHYAKLGEKVAA